MPSISFTRSFISEKALITYWGNTPPDSSRFYVGLADTNTLDKTSDPINFIKAELEPRYGYSRQPFLYEDTGTYNTSAERHEMPDITVEFTASGGSLQFQTAFLMADGHPTSAWTQSDVTFNPTTNRIIIPSHGLTYGNAVMFTVSDNSVLPPPIDAGRKYFVADPTEDDFWLKPDVASGTIDLQNTGSGQFYLRTIPRLIVAYSIEDAPIQILDGTTHSYRIPIYERGI